MLQSHDWPGALGNSVYLKCSKEKKKGKKSGYEPVSCFSSKIIVIVIRCVWWCINSQMLSPSLQTESHSDIFHIDSCSGAANAKNETASLLPLLVSHFIFGLILNGLVFFHALKRAD